MEKNIAIFLWNMNDTLLFSIFQILSSKLYIILTSLPFIILAFMKIKKEAIIFLITAIIAVSASDIICYRILKPTIKRLRPSYELNLTNHENNITAKAYSMPSNHASNTFAFFTVYFLLVRRFWGLLFINSILIAASRIVLVKHYPSDVLVGIAVGLLLGLLMFCLLSLFKLRYNKSIE